MRWLFRGIALVGLLTMGWSAARSRQYSYTFGEDIPCAILGKCDSAQIEQALERLWLLTGIGFAIVLIGLALDVLVYRRSPQPTDREPAPRWLHAVLAAGMAVMITVAASPFLAVGIWGTTQMLAAALTGWWLLLAVALDPVHRLCAPHDAPPRAEFSALAAASLAVGVTSWWVAAGLGPALWPALVLPGVITALAVFVLRLLPHVYRDQLPARSSDPTSAQDADTRRDAGAVR